VAFLVIVGGVILRSQRVHLLDERTGQRYTHRTCRLVGVVTVRLRHKIGRRLAAVMAVVAGEVITDEGHLVMNRKSGPDAH
jgi:hypothetical protein